MKKIYFLLAVCAFSYQGYAQPANDDCANAAELTINPDELCGTVTAGTLAGATDSGEGDNGAGVPNDDVWYTFIATATAHTISISNVSGTPTDLVHEVLEGTCGGGLTNVALTDDPDESVVYGLTVGNTYYLRIYSYRTAAAESTTFDLCLGTPPPPPDPPANDDCTNAASVTPNADNECGSVIAGTLSGATNSNEGDNGGGTPNDDVWYTFEATASTHIFRLLDVTGDTTDLMHEVMEGTCGGGLTSLSLSDPNTSTVSDLVVGNSYYVRVFSYQSAPSISTDFSLCIGTPPPAPANDDCSDAVEITPNADNECTTVTTGTLAGATDSGEGDNGSGNPNDDVWYTFVATNTTHIFRLLDIEGDTTDLMHEVMEGTCGGGLSSISLSDPETSTVSNLVVGNTYYVRVFSYQTAASLSTNFSLCVGSPPAAPANDACSDAATITPNADNDCGTVATGTLSGATDSGEGDNGGGVPSDDVWYTFVATNTTHIFRVLNVTGDVTDLMHEVMEGTCGGGLSSLSLSDPNTSTVSNLVVGNTYYVRVFSYQTAPSLSTNFSLCVGSPPSAPANDDCNAAAALTVNDDDSCTAHTSGTLSGATNSDEGDNGAGLPSDDVWYTFVAAAETHTVNLFNVTGDTTDIVHEVMEGSCGGGLSSLNISDPNSSTVSNLTVGNTYYVRVFSYQAAPSVSTNFSICVGTLPSQPANDECDGAITLTVGNSYAAGAVNASVGSATDSNANGTVPAPACANGYNGGDIWYTTVIPESGSLVIETGDSSAGISGFDSVVAVYGGTSCDDLTSISCDDDGAATGAYSKVTLSNRTPGEVIYIRVYEYGNDANAPFSISAYDVNLATTAFNAANFNAHPNPVTDILNLSYTKNISNVEVYNLLGQQILFKTVNNREDKLDMSHLTAGTYLVRVTAEGQTKTIKIIKR